MEVIREERCRRGRGRFDPVIGEGVASADSLQVTPTLTVSPTTVAVGGSVTATVTANCRDGETINLSIEPIGDFVPGFCTANRYLGRLTAPQQPGSYNVIGAGGALLGLGRIQHLPRRRSHR